MTETLQCLKKHGQRLDLEIARELRVPLATVRQHLTALAESREAIICKTIQFEKGRPFEAWQGRVSGFFPPAAPGRKPKTKAKG
jgi:predicted ArsR family transcriptional regulator